MQRHSAAVRARSPEARRLSGAIPALRADIEFRERRDGMVELRDPHLLQILTVHVDDFAVARAFDGRLDAAALSLLHRRAEGWSKRRIESIAREFEGLYLLDTPAARRAEPEPENVAPPSLLGGRRGLPVLPEAEPSARWACHRCGACCRGLAVELSEEEDARIDRERYDDLLEGTDYAEEQFINPREPARRVLRHKGPDDDRCIFLLSDGNCAVHARQGGHAKPNACQLFPFLVVRIPRRPARLGVRLNCQSMFQTYEAGRPVAEEAKPVQQIIARLDVHAAPARVELFGAEISFAAYDRWSSRVLAASGEAITPERVRAVDRELLEGRVRRVRRRYGRRLLTYVEQEVSQDVPVEIGAYARSLRRVNRGKEALAAMARGVSPPAVPLKVGTFLRRQLGHALWLCGPLNAPDAGYGMVALFLALEASLHAVGPKGDLRAANQAFDVFTAPLLEQLEHAWPLLEAIDFRYAEQIKKEM